MKAKLKGLQIDSLEVSFFKSFAAFFRGLVTVPGPNDYRCVSLVSASVSSGVNLGLKNRFGQEDERVNSVDDTQIGDYETDLQNAPSARLDPCFPLIPLFSSLDVDRFNEIIDNALQLVKRYTMSPAADNAQATATRKINGQVDDHVNALGKAWSPAQ